ncbi:hypothetical protein K458DRAFT_393607 [Lentithecium fluviatile CBS 122367]|uniref:Rhodopsin domain-containing protein n=1 Tax=Lentithecium fluviatile CBS 122367 TaxID=1168545 RepID=A0A6G1INF1_9PLEO|nr:hypothetical protein K458DRAFT_393607 [Lentithecium fluviatile CBS 122367]
MWMPASTLSSRALSITPDNKSDAVTITTWVTLGTLVVAFFARAAIKYKVVQKVTIDDLFILLATVFAICLSITSLILASDGIGVFDDLTLKRANALMKAYYASNFLYIATIGLAKLSLITFFYRDHNQRNQHRYVLGFGIFVLAWTLISIVAVAFQCGLPKPWEVFTLHCYNSGVFWIVYCIIDMTTDVSIIMLSVNLAVYSRDRFSRKFAVVACFAPRVVVVGASLARLVYLYPITPHDNPAFELWIPTICTQVQVCLSIMTACIPFVGLFFMGGASGNWRGEGFKRRRAAPDEESSYGCCSYTHLKGHKRGQNSSVDSSIFTNSNIGKTPDVSPRLPSPRPLSPLTPPRLRTPSSSTAGSTRSGLRVVIPAPTHPPQATHPDVTSPQTASSHALSPECLSPQPLLSPPQAFSPTSPNRREPSPPPPSHIPQPTALEVNASLDPSRNAGTSPPRFSLFPQPRAQRYSRLPQQHANSTLSAISERSRPGGQMSAQGVSPTGTPETRTRSRNSRGRFPVSPPTHSTPRFSRVLSEDSLRTKGTAITTSTPSPAPIVTTAPATSPYQAHSSIPSYYVTTPPTAHTSDPSSLQTIPSYYTHTPPTSQPPAFPLPVPPVPHPAEPASAPAPNQATSPQRQRNRRILTPQNSSRAHEMSPISPVTPPTPMNFWRDEEVRMEARIVDVSERVPMPRIRDVRSSPRIVVQQYP